MTLSLTSPDSTSIGVLGDQRPRVHRTPPYERSLGTEVVDFMAHVGKPLDDWQALMVLDTFGLRPDGYWSAFECAGLVPRQNGKGGYTEAVELGGLFLFGDQIIMHSAHLFKTAKRSFQRLIDIIDGSDWLTKRVRRVIRARGDEEIELTARAGGGRLLCFSRSAGAGRGFTGDKTVFDECAYLTVEQYQAATPTLATVPNPQIIYTGTPPDEDVGPMPEDAMMPSVRKRGHAGGDRIALWEWSPPSGYDRADPVVWAACNPSLGVRIQPWFLAKQLENFTAAGKPEKFDTEHLGFWPPDSDEQWLVIPEDTWNTAGDPQSRADGGVALGISMPDDRSRTTIAAFGRRVDGLRHAQLVEQGAGSAWVVPWVVDARRKRKVCAVVIGAADPARSLVPDFKEAGVEVLTPGTADVAAECGAVFDGFAGQDVAARDIRHPVQGPLTAAVAAAARKKAGNAWVWARVGAGVDVAPLYAVTAASYGFRVSPPADYDPLNSVLIGAG